MNSWEGWRFEWKFVFSLKIHRPKKRENFFNFLDGCLISLLINLGYLYFEKSTFYLMASLRKGFIQIKKKLWNFQTFVWNSSTTKLRNQKNFVFMFLFILNLDNLFCKLKECSLAPSDHVGDPKQLPFFTIGISPQLWNFTASFWFQWTLL